MLHDLRFSVGVIRDIDEIFELGHVDFLVLTGDEHGSHTEQLILAPWHRLCLTVAVNQVDRDVESLGQQLKLKMYLDQPGDENSAHAVRQVRLALARAVSTRGQLQLGRVHVIGAAGGHIRNFLDVVEADKISPGHVGRPAEVI